MKYEYLVKGIVHAGIINPWPVDKNNNFPKINLELNDLGEEGWELVSVIIAGNNDRAIYYFKRPISK